MPKRRIVFWTLGGLALVIACAFCVVGHRSAKKKAAIDSIHDAGAMIFYAHWKVPGETGYDPSRELAVPKWIKAVVGTHPFLAADYVFIREDGTRFGDREAQELVELPTITRLDLHDSRISDRAIGYLTQLNNLETLCLDRTTVSDAAIPDLRKMRGLRYLSLRDTRVSRDGVQALRASLPAVSIDYGVTPSSWCPEQSGDTNDDAFPYAGFPERCRELEARVGRE